MNAFLVIVLFYNNLGVHTHLYYTCILAYILFVCSDCSTPIYFTLPKSDIIYFFSYKLYRKRCNTMRVHMQSHIWSTQLGNVYLLQYFMMVLPPQYNRLNILCLSTYDSATYSCSRVHQTILPTNI